MRLKSHIWVSAYLRRLSGAFIPGVVVRRGDADAGAIYIKISHLDGTCQVLAPLSAHLAQGLSEDTFILEDGRMWQPIYASGGNEIDADAYLKKQASRDPDVWIIEVETPEGRHLLGQGALVFS